LAGGGRRHGDGSLPSIRRFEGEDAQEPTPSGVRDGFRQVLMLEQVGRLHVRAIDGIVALDKRKRDLVVEIVALAVKLLMRSGQQLDGLTA
jgi:hypothetical protein